MPIPEFIVDLRTKVGTDLLWLTGITAVVVRELDGIEEVLLVQRSDDLRWTPVNGIVDPGELPQRAAVREVFEEAGLVVEIERLVWVSVTGVVTYANGDRTQYLDHTFRCRWVEGDPVHDGDEVLSARWCRVDDLPELDTGNAERLAVALANLPECRLD